MLTVTKRFRFEAAHHLPLYDGPCHNVHGHSYVLDVTVTGKVRKSGTETGMIADFSVIKKLVKDTILNDLDHSDLNKVYENPTAEVMVHDIFMRLVPVMNRKGLTVTSCRLWETDTSYAEYTSEVI